MIGTSGLIFWGPAGLPDGDELLFCNSYSA